MKDYSSIQRELKKAQEKGGIVYSKSLDSFLGSDDERDLFAHLALYRSGKTFEVLAEDAPIGYSNIDLLMETKKWEIKSPNGESLRGVETAVRKARHQFKKQYLTSFAPRMVLNSAYHSLDDNTLISEYKKRLEQHGFKEALFVDKQGAVIVVAIERT